MNRFEHARALLDQFKGDAYRCGVDVLPEAGARLDAENMPVPLTPDRVDDTLGPVLEPACEGALEAVPAVKPD